MRVSRGLHLLAFDPTDLVAELAAWQLVLPPGSGFSHLTAALVRAWWVPPLPPDLPVFAAVRDAQPRPRRDGLVVCRHTQRFEVEEFHGLRVTHPAEILLAAARDLGLLDLVVLADAALHLRHCTMSELRVASARRRRGAPALRRALPYLDGRSESAWESMLRMLHSVCDLPVLPQYVVRDEDGAFCARADLRIPGTRRLSEYDGEVHRTAAQHARDLSRDRLLRPRLGAVRLQRRCSVARRGVGAQGRRRRARAAA